MVLERMNIIIINCFSALQNNLSIIIHEYYYTLLISYSGCEGITVFVYSEIHTWDSAEEYGHSYTYIAEKMKFTRGIVPCKVR